MSFVSVTPDVVGEAAGELDSIGSALSAANAAAAASTTGIVAPGADAVSAAVAALLGAHAEEYQAVGAQAADFHSQFVSLLNAGTGSYVSTELANARSTAAFGFGGGSGGVLSLLTGSIPGVPEVELAVAAAGPAVVALPVLEHQTGGFSTLCRRETWARQRPHSAAPSSDKPPSTAKTRYPCRCRGRYRVCKTWRSTFPLAVFSLPSSPSR